MQQADRALSPGTVLAGTIIVSGVPLVAVEMFSRLKFVISPASYLLFHNIAEFFSVMVCLSMFGIGWYTYDQSKNRHALFLSTAFLGIGLMDFMHTLANAAMPPFITPNSSNKSTQFWIAVRLFQAVAFLVSAYVYSERPGRWLSKKVLMTSVLLVSFLVFTGVIFFPAYLPATFVPGGGLTPFKKTSEYLIIAMLCAATLAYWRRITRTGDRLLIYYTAAFVICIFSEVSLAVYTKVFDTYNVLGHIYKVAAFFLIYHGVYRATVMAPYIGLTEVDEKLKGEIVERKRTEEALREAHNHLELRVLERTAELARSNEQLITEIEDRRKAEEALRASEERYRTLFSNMTEGFALHETITDAEGRPRDYRFLEVNPAFEQLTGLKCADLTGRRVLEVLPGIEAHWIERYGRVALTGEPTHFESYSAELGRWYEVFAYQSTPGQFAVIFTNITERKLAEEAVKVSLREKEVLLKEIHHRVKNNMQVISSLVALHAEELQDADMRAVLQDVTHRVRSMALVHEKLYQSADLARVEFAEYTQSLLDYLWRAYGNEASGIRLTLDLEPVSLSVNAAVPCGLILNELVSNALKHAFCGRDGGEVAVSLCGGAHGQMRLCVRDNGTGLPSGFDWRNARTLGLRLVQMLAGQLHAEVEVESGGGTEFTMTFGGQKQ